MSNPGEFRVETTRGLCVEAESSVFAAVVDAAGRLHDQYGESAVFPVRSTIKLLQAVPLIAAGGAEAASVSEQELALACSSHSGEDGHATAVLTWLERIGLDSDYLQCGAALPMIEEIAEVFLTSGGTRSPLRHNCSGKHAGFLTTSVFRGLDPKEYLQVGGSVQRDVLRQVSERCAVHLKETDITRDGCGAPTVCLALSDLARGLASTLSESSSSPEARLIQAMANNPWLVGGTERFDTALIERTGGRVISKIGADGMHVALARDEQLCVAVKSLSGTRVPAQVVLVELLHRLGVLSDDEAASLPLPVVRDDLGKQVGEVRIKP
jgi:L-asparaginase II